MTNLNKLPPDIEGIREIVKQIDKGRCPFFPKCLHREATDEECRDCGVTGWLSKLTEHGVVVLVSGDKFGTNISTGNGYYEVVNLDGTVKEG